MLTVVTIGPDVSHSQFQLGFAQFLFDFWLIFLLILSLHESHTTGNNNWLNNPNIMSGFCSTVTSFWSAYENKLTIDFSEVQQLLLFCCQLSSWVVYDSYKLRIKRKIKQKSDRNWAKPNWNWGWLTSGPIGGAL